MTKAFISYHHRNDQVYREHLGTLAAHGAFYDQSVEVGDIDDNMEPQAIRRIIRDQYLRDSEVTILLCGTETKYRKHVDWELKSSMIDGAINRRSGILVVYAPTIRQDNWYADLPGEKEAIYSDYTGNWITLETKADFQNSHPYLPERIIDNLKNPNVKISVVQWDRIKNDPNALRFLVDATAKVAATNQYDLHLPMRMRDHNPNQYY